MVFETGRKQGIASKDPCFLPYLLFCLSRLSILLVCLCIFRFLFAVPSLVGLRAPHLFSAPNFLHMFFVRVRRNSMFKHDITKCALTSTKNLSTNQNQIMLDFGGWSTRRSHRKKKHQDGPEEAAERSIPTPYLPTRPPTECRPRPSSRSCPSSEPSLVFCQWRQQPRRRCSCNFRGKRIAPVMCPPMPSNDTTRSMRPQSGPGKGQ